MAERRNFQGYSEDLNKDRVHFIEIRGDLEVYLSAFVTSHKHVLEGGLHHSRGEEDTDDKTMITEEQIKRLLALHASFPDSQEFEKLSDVLTVTDADGNTLLSRAASDGHLAMVTFLLDCGAYVNHPNNNHDTPLMLAVDHSHQDVVSCLIQAGSDVNYFNIHFETPLKLAATRGSIEITQSLLKAGACPNYMSVAGDTALNRACNDGNLSIVKALLLAGADVNSVCNIYLNRLSPLLLSAKHQHVQIVSALLQAGAEVNSRNTFYQAGDTPLIHATRFSLVEVMHMFVLAGADINAQNALGHSALTVSICCKKSDAMKCLLSYGADVNHRTKSGDTPLILAAESGSASMCQELINRGALLDAVNDHGDTALIQASRTGHHEVVEVLIHAGADLNRHNNSYMSALRFAVGQSLFNCSPCLLHLLEAGVAVISELHYAVALGLTHVVQQLMAYKSIPVTIPGYLLSFIPSLPKEWRVSPFCVAMLTERIDIVQLFIDATFITDSDLRILHGNTAFKRYLRENARMESLHFLDLELARPLTLTSLSLLTVSKAIGFNSQTRQARVIGTGLPPMLQRKLLFIS